MVLSQGSSSFYANFEAAKSKLEDIYAEIEILRTLSSNETSELTMKIAELKSELSLDDTEIENLEAIILDEENEIERINRTLPVVENYYRNRILRYGVSASLGFIIGIWVSIFVLSFAWRRRE
jgi:predicted RNase H-like nuclease (RuvC/YqgF family)